jgi:membrane fusion protein, multidrug efflux system
MDMNEFDLTCEIGAAVQSSHEADEGESAVPDEKDALHEEIRALRLQLERLQAFQAPPHPEHEDSPEGLHGEEEDIGEPNRAALAKARRRWSPSRIALAGLIAAILCVGGFQLWKYVQSYQDTDDAQVDGYLDPISSRINGTISAVYVDNNQSVKKGQLLVQLDPRDYQVAVEQARAQLAQAQADVNSARQQHVAAVATVRQAEAQNYLAQRNAERYTLLSKLSVVSQSEFDQYDATARTQAATVKTDEAAAASALRAIASHEAQVQAAQSVLDQAMLNLSYTRITAPANGVIGNRSAELGQRIQPGQSLMALTQDQLWITANFKETQLARMRPGQPVTIHVDALGRDFEGHIENMPGATGSLYDLLPPENATGNYVKIVQRLPVRIAFDRGQDLTQLRPGMSVEPTVWLR